MLVLNDIHCGFRRAGGTTPTSREHLRTYLYNAFRGILNGTKEPHLLIVGDLFDDFEVDGRDWVETYLILNDKLASNPEFKVTIVAGNHDWSPKGTKVSGFEMLARVLQKQYGDQVEIVDINQWVHVDGDATMIAVAHCSNQDMFEQSLNEVLQNCVEGSTRHVFLHANFDNNFAVESDHSLNVSRDWAEKFKAAGVTLYFAHEHQARTDMGGSVVVFGNQWPTSVSDCLNNDVKYAHVFKDGSFEKIETWRADDQLTEGSFAAGHGGFGQIPWRELGECDPDGAQFIRVCGTASSNEAGDCISAIAKFRSRSNAFVITNAVKIEGITDNEALPESFEATKSFDVMEFILGNLDEKQQAAVKVLAAGAQQ